MFDARLHLAGRAADVEEAVTASEGHCDRVTFAGEDDMPSVEQLQNDIARFRKEEADLRKKFGDLQSDAAKAAAEARQKRERAIRTSSASMASSFLRNAEGWRRRPLTSRRRHRAFRRSSPTTASSRPRR